MESFKELYNRLLRQDTRMRPATEDERRIIHSVELELMDDLVRVCDKYNLSLLLGGGSCLGAVRHGGFIPWDDDMDFNMPRKDFEVLKSVFEFELGDKYRLYAPNYANGKAVCRFAKVVRKGTLVLESDNRNECVGICADIFPIENIPANSIGRILHGLHVEGTMFISGQVWFAKTSNKLLKKAMKGTVFGSMRLAGKQLLGEVFGVYPLDKWYNLVDKISNYKTSTKIMGVPTGRKHYFGEIFDETVYLPPKEVMFEGHKAYLPNDEVSYLTNLFGNYMEIPEESKREHHYIYGLQVDGKVVQ